MEYVKCVIKSQMTILHACCKPVDIDLGLHTDEQVHCYWTNLCVVSKS